MKTVSTSTATTFIPKNIKLTNVFSLISKLYICNLKKGESCVNHELSRNRNSFLMKSRIPETLSRFEVEITVDFYSF